MDSKLLIISGPTASGKTALSMKIANLFSAEIINADIGQFYTPFSVGTAKPDWKNQPVMHHLFDIINQPKDLTAFEYYNLVLNKAEEIWKEDKLPIVVGGSLFYIKSFYFPPQKIKHKKNDIDIEKYVKEKKDLWKVLHEIDPDRANALHPNDIYRITRALQIWQETGIKPSAYKPEYNPKFNSVFVFISPSKQELQERINQRTIEMIKNEEWIQETKKIIGTEWETFLKMKGLIGYPEIIEWIKNGEKNQDLSVLIENIQCQTWQYAKRQITFWKSFKQLLIANKEKSDFVCDIIEVKGCDVQAVSLIEEYLNKNRQ